MKRASWPRVEKIVVVVVVVVGINRVISGLRKFILQVRKTRVIIVKVERRYRLERVGRRCWRSVCCSLRRLRLLLA